MEKITTKRLKELARSLMLDMSESDYEDLKEEFNIVLKQFDLINNIEGVDSKEPMTFPFEIQGVGLREDIEGPTLEIKDVLKNSKDHQFNQIKINRVVK
ncbi:TPA: hypothetical protein GXZ34_01180 [bacterium]|jgi:aspartyl/glutamyl-tRNA(Asn/Gln) amidotransferase C subunit|nr:hypothetical protein [bacterium]